jgi:phosphatidylglycerol---prolipoprotein diacylglyceryl transferase
VGPSVSAFFEQQLGAGWLAPNYPMLFSLAIVVGLYLAVRQAKQTGLDQFRVFKVGVITLCAALISARLFVVLEKFSYYSERPAEIFYYWQDGLASSGAYLGGLMAVFISSWWIGLRPVKFLDVAAPSIALAICVGRIACFINGCCYGKPSDLPWAVSFPAGSEAHYQQLLKGVVEPGQASLPLHPTQLYEALFGLCLFFLLIRLRKRGRRDGEMIALLFLVYSCARFFFEFTRGDDRWMIAGISVPQYLSIVGVVLSGWFLFARRRRELANSDARSGPEFRLPVTDARPIS